MNNQIFRKKSIDRISSPEQLNDYIRVANPGVWMVLSAVIILLAGICVWGIFGHLDTTMNTVGVCENGNLTCYISEDDISSVKEGMKITVDNSEYEITSVSKSPVTIDSNIDSYALHLGNLQIGQWVYKISAVTNLDNGTYEAKITTESISPISFVMN